MNGGFGFREPAKHAFARSALRVGQLARIDDCFDMVQMAVFVLVRCN